jgi:hypothetical protein
MTLKTWVASFKNMQIFTRRYWRFYVFSFYLRFTLSLFPREFPIRIMTIHKFQVSYIRASYFPPDTVGRKVKIAYGNLFCIIFIN